MDKLGNNDDRLLKDLFQQSLTTSPPGLSEEVMKRIEENSKVFRYEPIIKPWIWWSTSGLFAAIMVYLFVQLEGGSFSLFPAYEMIDFVVTDGAAWFLSLITGIRLPELPGLYVITMIIFIVSGFSLMFSLGRSQKVSFR